jgi:predicted Zn-dependent peptidase
MLDADLAALYGVTTKRLNEQVKRNLARFPEDFMFRLTAGETGNLRSQSATSSSDWGGRRKLPNAFTEHGAVMLASVLSSPTAVETSVQIVRAFVRLRQLLESNVELARKLDALEQRYDSQFRVVFQAIRELMAPPVKPPKRIGFGAPGPDTQP